MRLHVIRKGGKGQFARKGKGKVSKEETKEKVVTDAEEEAKASAVQDSAEAEGSVANELRTQIYRIVVRTDRQHATCTRFCLSFSKVEGGGACG